MLHNKILPFGRQARGHWWDNFAADFPSVWFRQMKRSRRGWYHRRRQGVIGQARAADRQRTRCTLWKHNVEVTDIEKHTSLRVSLGIHPATCVQISSWHVHTPALTERRLINVCEWVRKCQNVPVDRAHRCNLKFNAANKVMKPFRETKCSPLDLGTS